MKLLIILILLSYPTFGQDLNDEIMTYEELSAIMGWDSTTTEMREALQIVNRVPNWEMTFKQQFAELLREYEEECYADSVWVTIYGENASTHAIWKEKSRTIYNERLGRWEVQVYRPIREPTLPGLMEWVE